MRAIPDPDTPDMQIYKIIHRAMRGDARRLARAVATVEPGDARRAVALERWFEGYLHELHDHHTVEDVVFFPALADRLPAFEGSVARIDRDHALLDELLEASSTTLRDLAVGRHTWASDQRAAAEATAALANLIETHLDFEDLEVLPLFEEVFSAAEYEAIDSRAIKHIPKSHLLFSVPWMVEWATDEERAANLSGAFNPFRLLWLVRRRSYARLADEALGPVSAPAPALGQAA